MKAGLCSLTLSLFSPMFHRMLCSTAFREHTSKCLELPELDSLDGAAFKVFHLWCGKSILKKDWSDLLLLAEVADRFQVDEVSRFLESAILNELNTSNCCEVLEWSLQTYQKAAEIGSRRLAQQNF
jgi:hypothetical protein